MNLNLQNWSASSANSHGIFSLGRLREVQKYSKFYASGSGNKFALGAIRAIYEQSLSAEEIAKLGRETAADFDEDTGLPIEFM